MTGGRHFALVTLVDPSPADKLYIRDVARMYTRLTNHFETIDVRRYRAAENTAAVTLVDRFALFAAMRFDGVPYEQLLAKLAGTPNLVFLTSDLHSWSLFPDLPAAKRNSQLTRADNDYGRMFDMFDRLDIGHLITSYDCPELADINVLRPELQTHVVNLHVDPSVFRDHHEEKKYDVIVYGAVDHPVYAFRRRVVDLLQRSRQFKVLHVQSKRARYKKRNSGVNLARKINQSWLGLANVTDFSYLLGRYFEIPACNTAVLGDMNDQGAAIFGDNYVHVDEEMTDREIIGVVEDALTDRERLQQMTAHMYRVIHGGHTFAHWDQKLSDIAAGIAVGVAAGI